MNSWGMQLLVDARDGDNALITDKENIQKFVNELIEKIDMVPYGPTWIEHFATHDPDKAGISFCQMIETSNITGHFVDLDGSFYIDIFSCKEFTIDTVLILINNYFSPSTMDAQLVYRGVYENKNEIPVDTL